MGILIYLWISHKFLKRVILKRIISWVFEERDFIKKIEYFIFKKLKWLNKKGYLISVFFLGERDFDGEIPKERTNSLKKKKDFLSTLENCFQD